MMQGSKVDSNVCLHTNCYLPAWLAKHRQAEDLFTNMKHRNEEHYGRSDHYIHKYRKPQK